MMVATYLILLMAVLAGSRCNDELELDPPDWKKAEDMITRCRHII